MEETCEYGEESATKQILQQLPPKKPGPLATWFLFGLGSLPWTNSLPKGIITPLPRPLFSPHSFPKACQFKDISQVKAAWA